MMATTTDTKCLALPRGATCYWKEMWEKLNLMRQMWQLCDVTLFSDDNIMFMAHSPVLAASSEVFHNYFVKRVPTIIDELADRKLMLHGVRGDVLQVVLDFIYGVTPPTIEEFEKLKIGADALAIHGAYTYCGEKFYKSQSTMGAGKGVDDAGGRGQSVIVYSKPQSPVPMAKPKVCPVTNIPGGGRQVCPVSNILGPITGGCDDLEQVESNSFPGGGALIPSSDADGSSANLLSNDIEMRPVSGDVLSADCSASEPNETITTNNMTLTAQVPGNAQMPSPTGMNRCPVNMGNAANANSFSPRDIHPLSSPVTCPYNGETNSPVTKQDRIAPLTSDVGGKRNSWANSMLPTAPLFIPDLTPMWQSTNPGDGQNCCRSDGMPLVDLSNDMLDKSAVEHSQTSGHHDLIPEMTLSDLTVQLECPHLKRIASDERIASGNSDAMKAEGGASSPKSAASPDNDYTDCSSEGSNHESCSTDRQSKFSSNFLVCNIIDAPRDPQICNDNVNDRYFRQLDEMPGATTTNMLGRTLDVHKTAICKVEPPPDGATSGQSPDACSSENSNNSDTSTEVWAVHSGRPPTAEEVVENTKLLSRLKLNEKKSYTCLVDGCGYTNKHVDYMCSHMYHRHTMGLPTKHCGHCTKAYFSLGQLNNHIKRIHRVKRLVVDAERVTCADCGDTFDSGYKLQTHQLKVHGKGKLFSCEVCEFKSPRKKDVQAHMLSQHGKAPPGVRVYSCPFCEYKCIDRNRYEEHEAMHTGIQKFECPLCGKAYTTRRGMRTHLKYHSEDRPHKCDICDACFKVRSKLKDHVKLVHTHAGLKPYQCGYCDHSTALRGNCNQHIKKYHPGKPIQVIDHLASKRKSVKDYDYAGLKGDGIHECKDVRAASWASIGNSANFCPPSGPINVIEQEHGAGVLDVAFQGGGGGGATCLTNLNSGNISAEVNQPRPSMYL